jgi:predicted HAD superfamily Cof-like phosphohydrolase
LKKQIKQVRNWHEKFGRCVSAFPTAFPSTTSCEMRHRIMAEENEEYLAAAVAGDRTEILDALGDQLFVLIGTILTHGMQDVIEEAFDRIAASNLSKLGADGKPIVRDDGKILKGPNFQPPKLRDLADWAWR